MKYESGNGLLIDYHKPVLVWEQMEVSSNKRLASSQQLFVPGPFPQDGNLPIAPVIEAWLV